MPTLTIRNVPADVVARLKKTATSHNRSMEQEVRELLRQHFMTKAEALEAIRESCKTIPPASADEINRWIGAGRGRR